MRREASTRWRPSTSQAARQKRRLIFTGGRNEDATPEDGQKGGMHLP